MCLLFLIEIDGIFSNYTLFFLDVSAYYCFVPLVLGALFLSPVIPITRKLLSRILLGLWLALFLLSGFGQLFRHNFPTSYQPWTGLLIYGLLLGIPLLVIAYKSIASLGPIRLTVYAGFLLVLVYTLLKFSFGYHWFGMYSCLRLDMGGMSQDRDWTSYLLVWLGYENWVSYRLFAYLGLGYLLAMRKGFLIGVAISILIALADSTLGWIVFLPHDADFETAPFRLVLQYDLLELLKALLAQTVNLSLFALLGALITLIPWRPAVQHVVRLVSVTKTRYRPARRITSITRLGRNPSL